VLFAGLADLDPINTWTWDGKTWTKKSPQTQPPKLFEVGSSFDPILGRVIVFGGGQSLTWSWDGKNWSPIVTPQTPMARDAPGLAYDSTSSQLLLFGGYDTQSRSLVNDTWELVGH
jgi:photosystem II stability/assembly factor-like uncharacterized protein